MQVRHTLGRLRNRLMMRSPALRRAQWLYKSEPAKFTPAKGDMPACPACGGAVTHTSDYPSRAAVFSKCTVHYCGSCGFGFVPQMGPVLEEYYKGRYGRANRGDRQVEPVEYFDSQITGPDAALYKYAARAERQIKLLKQHGSIFDSVLDYGSGPGYLLNATGSQDMHAVEPDTMSHKYLAHLGAVIHADAAALPRAAFDVIVASHTLEHLPSEDLQSTLSALINALNPQGRLLIEVPQGGHSYLHLAGHRQDPHTLFFSSDALIAAIQKAGGHVLFKAAMGRLETEPRSDPIYNPQGDAFSKTTRGSLTVICTRQPERQLKTEPEAFVPLEGEGPACPACNTPATHSSEYPSLAKPFADHDVLYCSACGLGFVPQMGPVLEEYYKRDYANTNRGDRQVAPATYFQQLGVGNKPGLAKYKARVARQIKVLKAQGAQFDRVLDYGSGPGYFLHACGGRELHAVEPDELSHKYLAHLEATVHTGVGSLPAASFDTIVASHSIEHLPAEELHSTLTALVNALTPDGRLLIEVPQGGHSHLHLGGHRQDPHTLFFTSQALVRAVQAVSTNILFCRAFGSVPSPRRTNGVYTAEGSRFIMTTGGSLTVVCKPRKRKPAKV